MGVKKILRIANHRMPTLPNPTLPYPTLPYPTLPYPALPNTQYPTLPVATLPYRLTYRLLLFLFRHFGAVLRFDRRVRVVE